MLSPGSVRGVGNCLSASGLWEKWNQIEERCAEWADSREWLSWLEVYKWKDREIPNRLFPLSKHILNCQYLFSRLWDVCPGNWWTAGNQNSPKGKELEKRMKSRRKRKIETPAVYGMIVSTGEQARKHGQDLRGQTESRSWDTNRKERPRSDVWMFLALINIWTLTKDDRCLPQGVKSRNYITFLCSMLLSKNQNENNHFPSCGDFKAEILKTVVLAAAAGMTICWEWELSGPTQTYYIRNLKG